jgi:hypothetical protein
LSKKKELKRALKDPNTVHQTRLRDGRVVTWKGKDNAPLREAMKASPGYGEPREAQAQAEEAQGLRAGLPGRCARHGEAQQALRQR